MRLLRPSLVLLFLSAIVPTGCRQDDEIKKEIFTFQDREVIEKRIAIVERDDLVWFFLLSGPKAEVQKHTPAFDAFVRSAKIDEKLDMKKKDPPVVWEEPKDWRKDPGSSSFLRYAGFRIDAKPRELEVAVTRMAAKEFSLLANINRWEKQLNHATSENSDQLGGHVKVTREKINDQAVTWVDLEGLAVHTVSRPPEVAANPKAFMPPLDLKKPAARGGGIPFKYEVPKGWTKKPPNSIELEIYEIAEGDKKAKLTFSTVGGTVAMNINRWRVQQVGLPGIANDAEVERSADRITIAGIKSYYVDLSGKIRILGAIVPVGDDNWYIKMTGPVDWVGQNKNAFETFVKSIELDAR